MVINTFAPILNILAATEGEGGVAALGIDIQALIFQMVSFAIVFFILKKYAFGPISKVLEQRRKSIEESLKNAAEIEQRTEELDKKFDAKLRQARAEADKIIAQANEQAGEVAKAAEDRTAAKTDQMIKDAHARIGADVQQAKKELEKETLDLVASATETILREKIDRNKDAQLLAKSMDQVKEEV